MATTSGNASRLDIGAILMFCRIGTLHDRGNALITSRASDVRTPAGVRVRVSTRMHVDNMIAVLEREGYAVQLDSRPDSEEFGEALLVTGWSVDGLRRRAARGDRIVREIVAAYDTLAADVVGLFNEYLDKYGMSEAQAANATKKVFANKVYADVVQLIEGAPGEGEDAGVAAPADGDAVTFYRQRIETSDDWLDALMGAYRDVAYDAVALYRSYLGTGDYSPERAGAEVVRKLGGGQPPWADVALREIAVAA